MAEATVKEEKEGAMFSHQLLCQYCNKTFAENTPVACEHRTFCGECLQRYGIGRPGRHIVCRSCAASVRSTIYHGETQTHLDVEQDTFSLLHLVCKAKRGLLNDNPALHLLCKELSEVLNITRSRPHRDDAKSSLFSDSTQSSNQPHSARRVHDSDQHPRESESNSESDCVDQHSIQEPAVADTQQQSEHAAVGSSPGSVHTSKPSPLSGSSRSSSGGAPPEEPAGTKPCCRPKCQTCPIVKNVSSLTSRSTGKTFNVEGNFTCMSKCVIYCIECENCQKRYIGETKQMLSSRISQHRRSIEDEATNATGSLLYTHFNASGHNKYSVCVLKRFPHNTLTSTIQEEEKKIMLRLGTVEPQGLNKG